MSPAIRELAQGLSRRTLLKGTIASVTASVASCAAAPALTNAHVQAAASQPPPEPLHQRPALADRRFASPAVEAAITRVSAQIADPELRQIFANCLPNTLDTTVFPGTYEGQPDTFVITGDIDAMWLRDSSAQLWPYLPFCRQDPALADLVEGAIRRQTRCIALDPYANAFLRSPSDPPLSWSVHDDTTMHPGVGERKWEIDSLCYTIRLAHGYWQATGSLAPFDAAWACSARLALDTFREQQRTSSASGQGGPYHFQREAASPTDTLPLKGYGNPARPVGLIYSGFRPSDDACIYPLFIPANLFAVASLHQLAELASATHNAALANDCTALAKEVSSALTQHGQITHPQHGRIWAYEVDGYGNTLAMDDANAPGLLSLAYLGCVPPGDPLTQRTRAFALSPANAYFFRGSAAEGIGGPHIGTDFIWPMSILMRALTSADDTEIFKCLTWLRNTTAGTHYMHESFHKDDPANYTRPWFAWANTLFGELILKLATERPALLQHSFS